MMPELFRIPIPGFLQGLLGAELPIHSYGLMLVIGFLTAMQLAKFLGNRMGLDGEIFVNAGLLALVTGIVGARLSHILENWSEFADSRKTLFENLRTMANLTSGGLTFYGGFLLAFPTLVLYARWKKLPLRLSMDIVAPCLLIGLGFGRIGCYLNGCCYGGECAVPWAVTFPYGSNAYADQYGANRIDEHTVPAQLKFESRPDSQTGGRLKPALVKRDDPALRHNPSLADLAAHQHSRPVHPAQIYSAITAFLIAALLLAYFTVPHVPGRAFAWMLVLEGSTRFLLEILRVEPGVAFQDLISLRPAYGDMDTRGLSLSMILGVALVALGIVLWLAFAKAGGRTPTLTTNPTPAH